MSSCGGREGVARQYVRPKVPCLRWTHELHRCYICVLKLLLDVKGQTISHVKSHL
ncbi:MYBR domain class transcription factor [Medicago truncatula]|uniref:MYBR domain class transcription factor n=1 Tax=Medicago truncatula TaxID=3880 RepID=G7K9Y0_MEDTR|nr:MYBR domain class transcription factor [Medicago truncatula]